MNPLKLVLVVCLSVTVFELSSLTSEAQDIGQGYSCDENVILKKNKEVKLSKAKEAIQNKIDAVQGNTAKAKAKKAELKEIKANLTKCTKGTLSGTPGADVNLGHFDGILLLTETIPGANPDDCLTTNDLNTGFTAIQNGKNIRFSIADSGHTGKVNGSGFTATLVIGNETYSRTSTYTVTKITAADAFVSFNRFVERNGVKTCDQTYTATFVRSPPTSNF